MKKTAIIMNRWKRFTDDIYACSDLDSLLNQINNFSTNDFEEVSKHLWEEAEIMNNPSVSDFIENERIAYKLLEQLHKENRKSRKFQIRKWGSVAATILLCLSFYYTYSFYNDKELASTFLEIHVPYGEMHEDTLPDGTRVILNAGSVLKYPQKFNSDIRYVEFLGEGFFDVSKQKERAFIINTGGCNIKVLGTSFNLKNYNDSKFLSVTLCSGKIQMNFKEEQIILRPGEQLLLNKHSNELEKSKVNTQNYTSWMKGKLHFNKTPIEEVVKTLERYYNCRITLEPQGIFTNKISGTHDNKNLEAVLHSIRLATGIKSRKENGHYILYNDKQR